MSSILKALKKLEREKSRQRDDHIDLARDIFRGSERRSRPDGLTVLIAVAVALTIVAVILFVLRQMERGVIGGETAAPAVTSRPVISPPVPGASESVVEELIDQRRPQTRPPGVLRSKPTSKRERPAVAVIPPGVGEAVVVEETLTPPVPPVPPPAAQAALVPSTAAASPAPETAPAIAPAPASLVLTAIVFQAEREARLAVINDLPVMEGSLVEEYLVEEIQADRVLLSRNGALFEVRTP